MRWIKEMPWSITSVQFIVPWCFPLLTFCLAQVFHRSVGICCTRTYFGLYCQLLAQNSDCFTRISALDYSEEHAEHLVSTVQGFCSLLCSRGHSGRECVLRRVVCQDICCTGWWCPEGIQHTWNMTVCSLYLSQINQALPPLLEFVHSWGSGKYLAVNYWKCGLLSIYPSVSAEDEM